MSRSAKSAWGRTALMAHAGADTDNTGAGTLPALRGGNAGAPLRAGSRSKGRGGTDGPKC